MGEASEGSERSGATISIRQLADRILDWKGIADQAGQPIPCTPEAREKLLRDYPMLRDQIAAALGVTVEGVD